jgi:hypothetical protein
MPAAPTAGPAVENLYELPISEALLLADTRQDAAWAAAHPEMAARFEAGMRAAAAAQAADPALARGFANQAAAVQATMPTSGSAGSRRRPWCSAAATTAATPSAGGRHGPRIPVARHETVESGHGSWVADPAVLGHDRRLFCWTRADLAAGSPQNPPGERNSAPSFVCRRPARLAHLFRPGRAHHAGNGRLDRPR